MSIGDVGRVPLSAPINLQGVQDTEIQQAAVRIQQQGQAADPNFDLSLDQIVSSLQYLKDNNIQLNQRHIDNLVAGEPVITPPSNFDAGAVVESVREQLSSNPWLRANPMATFTVIYLELAAVLSQAKLEEGMIAADSVILMAQLAEEIADLIIELGEAERDAYIVSACMALASGVTQIAGGFAAIKMSRVQGEHGMTTDSGLLSTRTMQVQGISKLFDAGDAISKAIHAMKKAELDALKTITENMLKAMERRASGATEEYKANNDMLTQVLQNLQKIIDEAYKAHGWQVH